jgi:hypothetical protein
MMRGEPRSVGGLSVRQAHLIARSGASNPETASVQLIASSSLLRTRRDLSGHASADTPQARVGNPRDAVHADPACAVAPRIILIRFKQASSPASLRYAGEESK